MTIYPPRYTFREVRWSGVFAQCFGRSPHVQIRLFQIEAVQELLVEPRLSIEAIAELTGFAHPEYLGVVFKRVMGETVGKFRRRLLGR